MDLDDLIIRIEVVDVAREFTSGDKGLQLPFSLAAVNPDKPYHENFFSRFIDYYVFHEVWC